MHVCVCGGGGGGGVNRTPSLCFRHHSPIDTIPGSYNELPLYFQLSKTVWCLTSFHGNHRYKNDVTSRPPSWIFKFSDFIQI